MGCIKLEDVVYYASKTQFTAFDILKISASVLSIEISWFSQDEISSKIMGEADVMQSDLANYVSIQ
jgi:hypothetical protein